MAEENVDSLYFQDSLDQLFGADWYSIYNFDIGGFEQREQNVPSASGLQDVNWNSEVFGDLNQNQPFVEYNSLNIETISEEQEIQPVQSASSSLARETTPIVASSSTLRSSLPSSETWPGEYNFTASFPHQEILEKGATWTYSAIIDKLYVKKDAACPVNFSVNTILSNDFCIRAMALFSSPNQINHIVKRCVNHSMNETEEGVTEAEHLIRCENLAASYYEDPLTKRHSVIIPYENPAVGQEYITGLYKFACYGSCAGGPNRRPIMLIFTLERDNVVVGRRKLDVKICACPRRDRKSEEAHFNKNKQEAVKRKELEPVSASEGSNLTKYNSLIPKKSKLDTNKGFFIYVNDEECYNFLIQMKQFSELVNIFDFFATFRPAL